MKVGGMENEEHVDKEQNILLCNQILYFVMQSHIVSVFNS